MAALSTKTVLLVTHQVDFLPAFDSVLVSLTSLGAVFHTVLHKISLFILLILLILAAIRPSNHDDIALKLSQFSY